MTPFTPLAIRGVGLFNFFERSQILVVIPVLNFFLKKGFMDSHSGTVFYGAVPSGAASFLW